MEKYPNLVAMCGLSRSGKTTIVKREYIPQGYAVVSPDDIRLSLYGGRFAPEAEGFVWAITEVMVDSLLRSGCKVVLDATNCTPERRKPWEKRGAIFHWVRTSKEVCIERAKAAQDAAIIPVIERQNSTFCPPMTSVTTVPPWRDLLEEMATVG